MKPPSSYALAPAANFAGENDKAFAGVGEILRMMVEELEMQIAEVTGLSWTRFREEEGGGARGRIRTGNLSLDLAKPSRNETDRLIKPLI